jgi:hypothetical protein
MSQDSKKSIKTIDIDWDTTNSNENLELVKMSLESLKF